MTDDLTKEDSPQTSTAPSPGKTGTDPAWERIEQTAQQFLDALNDPEAIKRGEQMDEEGIDIILTPEDGEPSADVIAPEDRKFAAALREIIDSMPPRQVRRVGWGWWYALQGTEPDPEDEHYLDWKFDILFEEALREVFPEAEREPTQEERGVNDDRRCEPTTG